MDTDTFRKLPELVREYRLQFTFENGVTIHPLPYNWVHPHLPKQDIWRRELKPLGRGGNGLVWLERKIVNGQRTTEKPELRAFKIIDANLTGGRHSHKLEALAKFPSQK